MAGRYHIHSSLEDGKSLLQDICPRKGHVGLSTLAENVWHPWWTSLLQTEGYHRAWGYGSRLWKNAHVSTHSSPLHTRGVWICSSDWEGGGVFDLPQSLWEPLLRALVSCTCSVLLCLCHDLHVDSEAVSRRAVCGLFGILHLCFRKGRQGVLTIWHEANTFLGFLRASRGAKRGHSS